VRRLHLGSGGETIAGWENHDRDVDLSAPLPYGDGSVNFIFTEHVLEHLRPTEAWNFFGECHRVLVPGGVVRTTVPSIVKVWENMRPDYVAFVQSHGGGDGHRPSAVKHLIFNYGHQSVWTPKTLVVFLQCAGFNTVYEEAPYHSRFADLNEIERHGNSIGRAFNELESIVVEAVK
jgi:predicted SAM-dependent methyltransferase